MARRGPKPNGFVRLGDVDAAPEVYDALRNLSDSSGVAFRALVRAALTDFVIEAGYLNPARREQMVAPYPLVHRKKERKQ